jgi:tRNA modification GTPase
MEELSYDTKRPIAALATPWGKSAIAVIRTAGEGCLELVCSIFSRPGAIRKAGNGTMVFGYLLDEDKKAIEQVMLGVFLPPGGYTGQESVEIYTHGSPPGIERILRRLMAIGFSGAAPGEFTLRAFLAGKLDLTEAEAVAEIIEAKSDVAHGMALGRLSGSLFERIDSLKHRLVDLLSAIEVVLDYPAEELLDAHEPDPGELGSIRNEIEKLASSFRGGKLYQDGAKIALAGRTNAGKSSLFNLFLREDRSIVSEVHGTTRDYIESWISIEGIPVSLFDTAGVREAGHPVEAEGIKRSGMLVDSADLVLYLVDASTELSADELLLLERERALGEESRYLFLAAKSDLASSSAIPDFFPVSAATGDGFEELQRHIVGKLRRNVPFPEGDVAVDSLRQKSLLDRASVSLGRVSEGFEASLAWDELAMDLKDAVDALGEITGEVTSADILESIFSGFCVGK